MKRYIHLTILVLLLASLFTVAGPRPSLAGGETRVMVEFAPGRGPAVRTALQRAGGQIHHELDRLNVFAVSLPAAAVQGIERNPSVVAVAEDTPRYLMAQETPWGIDRVQALDVQDTGVTGSGITVCVIDSGLYTAHEDINGKNVLGGYPSGWNTDGCGHGTHVAGTIAAQANALGVIGASPDVSLYIVKVFGDNCGWSYSSDLIDATQRCQDAGAHVINMSLGGGKAIGPWEQRQFDRLYNEGILSIASAGNAGNTQYSYPASYSSVVSVAATDENNVVADFSQKNDQVELSAPGVDVLSTVPWIATTSLTVDGVPYAANHIDYAPYGSADGALVDGGLCTSTGTWAGKVVLCERGQISFYDKVRNVQNGGGAAAVIYNNEPGPFLGTLGDGNTSTIVAISLSQEDGQSLVASKLEANATVNSSIQKPASGYEAWNGTSMAAPHVSAVAALLWSSARNLTNAQIRNAMTATALDLGASGRDTAYGYGLVQAYDALVYLGGGEPVDRPPSVTITEPLDGSTVAGTVTVSATATDDVGVTQVAFSVNGTFIGVGTNGTDGWSVTWDTTTFADGAVTVTATATDTAGQTATDSIQVVVNNVEEPPSAIQLSAIGYKVRGRQHADLSWSGATSSQVVIFRNGTEIATVANDGFHTDNIGATGGGSVTYQVCEVGTAVCSNQVTVTF